MLGFSDIINFIRNNLDLYLTDIKAIPELDQHLRDERKKFFLGIHNVHYYGFLQSGQTGDIYEFNSLRNSPVLRNEDGLRQFSRGVLQQNPGTMCVVYQKQNDREIQNDDTQHRIQIIDKPKILICNRNEEAQNDAQNKIQIIDKPKIIIRNRND